MANAIAKPEIHERFLDALGDSVVNQPDIDEFPMEIHLEPPLPPKVRVCAYPVTTPPGSNQNANHIVRIILPDQGPGERNSFDHSGGYLVLLVGYAEDPNVFILWDAGLHQNVLYGKQVHVKPGPVFEAVGGGIGTQERHLKTGTETVLTANANNLGVAIEKRSQLTTERLTG